ncbi:cytochrome c-type biogenesis protein CcmH [Hasllibacter halocynthiae]|uniref:Cytochrome c-type biogenesis protein CcmH n=1 Tax=Hasllibacter halocynthiae TaxID=595589 RepID=A0A2T0X2X2_9RHOB|nr:c-type cytochrome biogenesis protein CcmI [Hasllibacter halocynthiae]PRY93302.1 cytochrome c-type biogenesis protein CcmH [Hasllibacter halocynthiae]
MSVGFLLGAAVLLALCVLTILAAPRRGGAGRASAMAIFRDQMDELERDRAAGLVTEGEAEAARAEIGRRMIREDRRAAASTRAGSRAPLVTSAVLVPILGVALYAWLGSPDLEGQPAALRASERGAVAVASRGAAALAAELEEVDPAERPGDFLRLADLQSAAGRPDLAAGTLAPLAARQDAPSGVLTLWAEATLQANGGVVTDDVRRAVARALRADPLNPAAAFYLSVVAEADGESARAREILLRRLALAPGEEPWMPTFAARIDALGAGLGLGPVDLGAVVGTQAARVPGPSREDVRAADAMSEEDRRLMVEGMVEGLAARLAAEGGTPAEWLRLARSQVVLDDVAAARAAAEQGLAALGGEPDPEVAAALADLLAALP